MKKEFLSIVAVLFAFVMLPIVHAEEKVPVYMFTKEGCPACSSAEEYFTDLEAQYPDLFELIKIEVFDESWNVVDENLKELLIKVYDEFGEDSSKAATPTIVIGEYHTVGLPQDTDLVYDAIIAARDSENKVDKVQEFIEELNISLDKMPTEEKEETTGKYDTIIIIGIFVVLIGGFAGLVVAGKK